VNVAQTDAGSLGNLPLANLTAVPVSLNGTRHHQVGLELGRAQAHQPSFVIGQAKPISAAFV